jgi:hypothetical protein
MAKMEQDRRYLYSDFDENWKEATLARLDGQKQSRTQASPPLLAVHSGPIISVGCS